MAFQNAKMLRFFSFFVFLCALCVLCSEKTFIGSRPINSLSRFTGEGRGEGDPLERRPQAALPNQPSPYPSPNLGRGEKSPFRMEAGRLFMVYGASKRHEQLR